MNHFKRESNSELFQDLFDMPNATKQQIISTVDYYRQNSTFQEKKKEIEPVKKGINELEYLLVGHDEHKQKNLILLKQKVNKLPINTKIKANELLIDPFEREMLPINYIDNDGNVWSQL